MSNLTEQHIAVLRALVDHAHATNSDVGMDASVLAALLNDWTAVRQLADERLALIQKIEAVVDDGFNWTHTYDGDDSGEWVNCDGRDTIATLITDWRAAK